MPAATTVDREVVDSQIWLYHTYRCWVRQNRFLLELMDDMISRILFWTPSSSLSSSTTTTPWREIIGGALELHRFMIEMALEDNNNNHLSSMMLTNNPYGTSVVVAHPPGHNYRQSMNLTFGLRWTLTTLQILGPVLEQIFHASSTSDAHQQNHHSQRRLIWRRYMERIRFLLRWMLLVRYWRNFRQHLLIVQASSHKDKVLPGLLIHGGALFHPWRPPSTAITTTTTTTTGTYPTSVSMEWYNNTIQQECQQVERQYYVGRRTGRTLVVSESYHFDPLLQPSWFPLSSFSYSSSFFWKLLQWKHVFGELLYISRPLLQAEALAYITNQSSSLSQQQRQQKQQWYVWWITFGMDIISLHSLSSRQQQQQLQYHTSGSGSLNWMTCAEWYRRRERLWLYLLRTPMWDQYTAILVQRIATILQQRIPWIGSWMSYYWLDWFEYWRLYRTEE